MISSEVRTDDEYELDVIINGLQRQAGELDDEAEELLDNTMGVGACTLLIAAAALAIEASSEAWPHEEAEAIALTGVMAMTTAVQGGPLLPE